MITLGPILLALVLALASFEFWKWRSARHLDANSARLNDPKLRPVLDRLARALDLPQLAVHVYEIDPINGLAAPDGRIFLTRGFMRWHAAGDVTSEELASVVAHELGHVALGHSRRRGLDFAGANALRVAMVMALGRFVPGVIGVQIAHWAHQLLTRRLSRQDEYEADAYAAALMTKAGFGVGPQASLLAKLDRMAGFGGHPPVWLATHPPGRDRIAAIRTFEAKWRASPRRR